MAPALVGALRVLAIASLAHAYVSLWPAFDGAGGSYASNSTGVQVSAIGGVVIPTATTYTLPNMASARSLGSTVVVDSHATYVISGPGSIGWCSTTASSTSPPPTVVSALSPTGATLWSTLVAQSVSLPCNYSAGVWIDATVTLHPTLDYVYASGSCLLNQPSGPYVWGAWLTGLNATSGAAIFTVVSPDAPLPQPSNVGLVGCSPSMANSYSLTIDPSTGYLGWLKPSYALFSLTPATGQPVASVTIPLPNCTNGSVLRPSGVTTAKLAPGVAPQFLTSSMCIPATPGGTGVPSISYYSTAINPTRGTLSPPTPNGTFALLNMMGGVGDPLRNTLYAGNSSTLVRSSPTSGAPMPADVIFSVVNPNTTYLLGAIATQQGIIYAATVPAIIGWEGQPNPAASSSINVSAFDSKTLAPVGPPLVINVPWSGSQTRSLNPWGQLPLTTSQDGVVYMTTWSPVNNSAMCWVSVSGFIATAGSGGPGGGRIDLKVSAINVSYSSCSLTSSYAIAGPTPGIVTLAVVASGPGVAPNASTLVVLSTGTTATATATSTASSSATATRTMASGANATATSSFAPPSNGTATSTATATASATSTRSFATSNGTAFTATTTSAAFGNVTSTGTSTASLTATSTSTSTLTSSFVLPSTLTAYPSRGATSTSTSTATLSSSSTATSTRTAAATATAAVLTATASAAGAPTLTSTVSLTSSTTATATATSTSTGSATLSLSRTPTPTPSVSQVPTPSQSPSQTQSPSQALSNGASASSTNSQAPSPSQTGSMTGSRTQSQTPTQSATPTNSQASTPSASPTVSSSQTVPTSPSPSVSVSPISASPSTGASATPTSTVPASATPSNTAPASATPSNSPAAPPPASATPSQTAPASPSPSVSTTPAPASASQTSSVSQTPTQSLSYGASPSVTGTQAASATPSTTTTLSASSSTGVSPSVSTSAAPSASVTPSTTKGASTTPTPRPTPPGTCFDKLLDGSETDVDCGGAACAACATGRMCKYDSDCDQTGSTTAGTVYPPGTTMIVCSAATRTCVDLRAGSQAYNASIPTPGFVAFNLTVQGYPASLFSAGVLYQVDLVIASTLSSVGLPLVVTSDVLVTGVWATSVTLSRRRLASTQPNATMLAVRLLLRPATGYAPATAAGVVNANTGSIVAAIQNLLSGTRVAFLSADPATVAAPLPAISATGPAPVAPSAANGSGGSASAPTPVGLIVGVVIGVVLLIVVAVAAFCLMSPRKKRRENNPFSTSAKAVVAGAPQGGAVAGAAPPPPSRSADAVLNPLAGALTLRASAPPPPPPNRKPLPAAPPAPMPALPPDASDASSLVPAGLQEGAVSRGVIMGYSV